LITLQFVDSIEVRFAIQAMSFLVALVVGHMVWIEYRRNRSKFMQQLTISFTIMLLQAAYMLTIFIYSSVTGNRLPEIFLPMLDHFFKIIGFVYLCFAFVWIASDRPNLGKKMFNFNLVSLCILTPVFWYFWYHYLQAAPLDQQKFSYFWVDPIYEIWSTILLGFGLYSVSISQLRTKNLFILAFGIMLIKEVLHIANILLSSNTIPQILMLERLLAVPYFYVIIGAIHQMIVDEIQQVNSEKDSLNQQLNEERKLAVLGEMAAGIAHEIRNPLTTIRGFTDLVNSKSQEKNIKEYCSLILSATDDANKVVTEFLSFAKPSPLNYKEVSLNELVVFIKPIIENQCLLLNVSVEFSFAANEKKVWADEAQLRQVSLNLVKNALDALAGQVAPKLLLQTNLNQDTMILTVRDNGKGISNDDKQKLGKPFFTSKADGTGLGLSICLKLIEEHCGRIEFESTLGQGTTVSILLPVLGKATPASGSALKSPIMQFPQQ
jgi:signal transduction histidine kinase